MHVVRFLGPATPAACLDEVGHAYDRKHHRQRDGQFLTCTHVHFLRRGSWFGNVFGPCTRFVLE